VRFCPFCSAENTDESTVCETCGRRLPPRPPRARNAPPTGVQLPARAKPASNPPQNAPRANPPPMQPSGASAPRPAVAPPPTPPMTASGGSGPRPAVGDRAARPSQPPPLSPDRARPSQPPPIANAAHADASQLRNAINPGPAAQRREVPSVPREEIDPQGRRKSDHAASPMQGPPIKPPTTPPPARPASGIGFDDDFNTVPSASAYSGNDMTIPEASPFPADKSKPIASPFQSKPLPAPARSERSGAPLPKPITPDPIPVRSAVQTPTGVEPPPTRIAMVDRPFTPPKVDPVPEVPESGIINAARYAIRFGKARFQRRGAIKTLGADIKQDTEALDQVLGALGRAARTAKIDGRVFSAENQAITSAEERAFMLGQEHGDVDGRKAEENSKFLDVENERNTKLGAAERTVDETQKELANLETQRRTLRDKRKELERRQKAYLKAAEDAERQAGSAQMGEQRQDLRRSAEQHRRDAGALDPERQDMDRKLAALERPINEATARLDAAKAELDAAKRSLADAREGHTHRLAELDAEQKRKSREIALAEGEIARRLVTLGTLVNLNRIEDAQFRELYERIDRLRGAITSRTTEIEKLTAEREAYDRGMILRGLATIIGALVAIIALISILRAVL
jgi:hypothetical protein